jgi:diaminohydroxyphosphoribosylaminopyrimidine deaminase/5-amino-6-(5-phosphoribosylamino)uracil reductase
MKPGSNPDLPFLRAALRLARRGYGTTSPNPMVGAVLVQAGRVIGRGWHRRAGEPHAEIEALRDAKKRGHSPRGATLYVTLEPCSTHGRTPPCTQAIIDAGIRRVVVGAADPNPRHAGKGFPILGRAGIEVVTLHGCAGDPAAQRLATECIALNEVFNHWIVQRTPFVIVKAAMTLDGKIATASGQSQWITGEQARACGMNLRQGCDAILAGVNTILADDPSLTVRHQRKDGSWAATKPLRRFVLDTHARTPLTAKVVADAAAALTTIVVGPKAANSRVAALSRRVQVLTAPLTGSVIDLRWLLNQLGASGISSLLVEGGGEVNASFLLGGLAQRVAFFYAPKVLGGRDARKGVAGEGAKDWSEVINLRDLQWRQLGEDLFLTARTDALVK